MSMTTYTPPDSPLSTYTLLDDTDGYTIRSLTSTDIPAVCALFTKLHPTARPLTPAHLTRLLARPAHAVLVAFSALDTRTPVGLLAAARHEPTNDLAARPSPPHLDVQLLGVLPAHRRCGVATRLVAAAARRLRADGAVRAQVDVRDVSARAFWKQVGCVEEIEARPWRAGAAGEVVRFEGLVVL